MGKLVYFSVLFLNYDKWYKSKTIKTTFANIKETICSEYETFYKNTKIFFLVFAEFDRGAVAFLFHGAGLHLFRAGSIFRRKAL